MLSVILTWARYNMAVKQGICASLTSKRRRAIGFAVLTTVVLFQIYYKRMQISLLSNATVESISLSALPSVGPSASPSAPPRTSPSAPPSASPSASPSTSPSALPSGSPSSPPTATPTISPSSLPRSIPTGNPALNLLLQNKSGQDLFGISRGRPATSTNNSSDIPPTTLVGSLAQHVLVSTDLGRNSLSSLGLVRRKGYPWQWDKCTLNSTVLQSSKSLSPTSSSNNKLINLVLVGGSPSARTGFNCTLSPGNNKGRYSDILNVRLQDELLAYGKSSLHFRVSNMAHGGSSTFWNLLMLDQLVHTRDTDVLVWEYAVNDASGRSGPPRSEGNMVAEMNLWFWRVWKHFDGKPPPVILVYLWDASILENLEEDGKIPQRAFKAHSRVLEHYRSFGWQIAGINVGGAINATYAHRNIRDMVDDDNLHPSCQCEKFIAGLIRFVLYSDLETCTSQQLAQLQQQQSLGTLQNVVPMPMGQPFTQKNKKPARDLFRKDIVVGSKMNWEPNLEYSRLSMLSVGNVSIKADVGSKIVASRADRKKSYALPLCPETVDFRIDNPNLEWLGVRFGKSDFNITQYYINGINVRHHPLISDKYSVPFDSQHKVQVWTRLSEVQQAQREEGIGSSSPKHMYNISFCNEVDIRAKCPLKTKDKCFAWYNSQKGKDLRALYGSWVGVTERATGPHLAWIVGLFSSTSLPETSIDNATLPPSQVQGSLVV